MAILKPNLESPSWSTVAPTSTPLAQLGAMAALTRHQVLSSLPPSSCLKAPIRLASATSVRYSVPKAAGPAVHRSCRQGLQYSVRPRQTLRKAPLQCQSSSQPIVAAASAPSTEPSGFKWGADMKTLGIAVGLALAVWFIPPPSGVTAEAWHLLAIFLGTIVGIITKPLPLGAVAMMGLAATMLTKTLTFAQAFSAFSSEIP